MQGIKNQCLCSNVLSHLFFCPRSKFLVNDCPVCSPLFITSEKFSRKISALYKIIFTEDTFSELMQPLFNDCIKGSIKFFKIK